MDAGRGPFIPRLLLGGLRDFPVEEVGVLPLPLAGDDSLFLSTRCLFAFCCCRRDLSASSCF